MNLQRKVRLLYCMYSGRNQPKISVDLLYKSCRIINYVYVLNWRGLLVGEVLAQGFIHLIGSCVITVILW